MTRLLWTVCSHELPQLGWQTGIEKAQGAARLEHEDFRSSVDFLRIVAIRWFLQDRACRVDAMRS